MLAPLSPRRALSAAALSVLVASAAAAQVSVRSVRMARGLSRPLLVLAPPGDLERVLVVEQTGAVRVLRDGAVLPVPFLDLSGQVASGGEEGLLGMAFHPAYPADGRFFVAYSDVDGDTVVASFTVSADDPDRADPESETVVLGPVLQPTWVHNGGALAFAPDGKLFVALGDGGGPAPEAAQAPDTLLGKLLRLDVDLPAPHVPPDNPYVDVDGVLDPIWAVGLREPWRFSFDRVTGDLWIGDVGAGSREEVSFVPAEVVLDPGSEKLDFGWPCLEGTHCTGSDACSCASPGLIAPVEEFDHSVGCAVIGGHVYRGAEVPDLAGYYVYSTFCYAGAQSRVFAFRYDGETKEPTIELTAALRPAGPSSIDRVTSFGEDGAGELWLCDLDGDVFRLVCDDLAPGCGPGTPFCFGAGCPCANDPEHGDTGCAHSGGFGARMSGAGSTSLAAADLVLTVRDVPSPNASGLVFAGPSVLPRVTPLGADGFACTGGARLPGLPDDNAWPHELVQTDVVSTAAAVGLTFQPGETWHFQGWFRDGNGSPCGGLSNLSSAYSVTFTP